MLTDPPKKRGRTASPMQVDRTPTIFQTPGAPSKQRFHDDKVQKRQTRTIEPFRSADFTSIAPSDVVDALLELRAAVNEYLNDTSETWDATSLESRGSTIQASKDLIHSRGYDPLLASYYYSGVEEQFHKQVIGDFPDESGTVAELPQFLMDLRQAARNGVEDASFIHWCARHIPRIFDTLTQRIHHYNSGVDLFLNGDRRVRIQLRKILHGYIRRTLDSLYLSEELTDCTWKDVLGRFLDWTFLLSHKESMEDDIEDPGMLDAETQLSRLAQFASSARCIGQHDDLNEQLMDVTKKYIKKRINECRGVFDEPQLETCLAWMEEKIIHQWLARFFDASHEDQTTLPSWQTRLRVLTLAEFCSMRTSELFDVIRDVAAEEVPAEIVMQDLKASLSTSLQRDHLVKTLRASLENRVLHAGVRTGDIVNIMIATEQCLRILDPTSNLLLKTIKPVQEYLRRRDDTIKEVMSKILDPEGELADVMRNGVPVTEESGDYDTWEPEPIDAVGSQQERAADIITRLISIFDTKEVFVREYHKVLAAALLKKPDYETDEKIMEIELLKTRFGETSFHQCEIMLKDMADSRRIDSQIHSHGSAATPLVEVVPFHTTILSYLYWPELHSTPYRLPTPFEKAKGEYARAFKEQKPNRVLDWKTDAGVVEIEIELEDRVLEFQCTELQASVIYHFSGGPTRLSQLVDLLQSTESPVTLLPKIKDSIHFWMSNGVLKEVDQDCWDVVEREDELATQNNGRMTSAPLPTVDPAAQREREALEFRNTYQPLILSIVRSMGPQTFRQLVEVLASRHHYHESKEEDLRDVLGHLVGNRILEIGLGGLYKIRG
ncbi:Anaphase-promoting complex subunit 2 [Gaertneriomyces sp. JEL0708]|nr:Anaphase-promoting complex subunit 2 [Gaertneriomyces sp. JEL0708]